MKVDGGPVRRRRLPERKRAPLTPWRAVVWLRVDTPEGAGEGVPSWPALASMAAPEGAGEGVPRPALASMASALVLPLGAAVGEWTTRLMARGEVRWLVVVVAMGCAWRGVLG